jgi:hypothetical protein
MHHNDGTPAGVTTLFSFINIQFHEVDFKALKGTRSAPGQQSAVN